jgi:hypothetical protein
LVAPTILTAPTPRFHNVVRPAFVFLPSSTLVAPSMLTAPTPRFHDVVPWVSVFLPSSTLVAAEMAIVLTLSCQHAVPWVSASPLLLIFAPTIQTAPTPPFPTAVQLDSVFL